MESIYQKTADAFRALDFSDDNARLAEIKARLDDTTRAIEAGEQRMQQIHRTIAEARGPDGDAVADALLTHGDAALAANAARTGEQLEDEKASLTAGLQKLRQRAGDLRSERDSIRLQARHKARLASEPLVEAILEEQRQAALRLAEAYAAVRALDIATGGHGLAEKTLHEGLDGVMGSRKLIPAKRFVAVPDEILEVIASLPEHEPAFPVQSISEVQIY